MSIRLLIAMIVLSLALVIQTGVTVGVLLKLKREVKAAPLKYFGLISMVAQQYIMLMKKVKSYTTKPPSGANATSTTTRT